MVQLTKRNIVLVFGKDNLSLMENALLSALREIYGIGQVRVFSSLKRAESTMEDYPGYIVAVFDGRNSSHVDGVFDIFSNVDLAENDITRVLAVNRDLVIREVEQERFDHDELLLITETLQGEAMMSNLRKIFGVPVDSSSTGQQTNHIH